MSRAALAEQAQVAERTIADFEAGRRTSIAATREAIQRALEAAGVVFVDANGGGPGVRIS